MFERLLALVALVILIPMIPAFGQGHDHNWLLGYSDQDDPAYKNHVRLFFDENDLHMSDAVNYEAVPFRGTNSCYSDAYGRFQFASNGFYIMDKSGGMLNGSYRFNHGPFNRHYEVTGAPVAQGVVSLPIQSGRAVQLIHIKLNIENVDGRYYNIARGLYTSRIDLESDSLLLMTQKDVEVANEAFEAFGLTACRHANGRDWWFVAPRWEVNEYHVFLVNDEGVMLHHIDTVDQPLQIPQANGQACFSPDGRSYARVWKNASTEMFAVVHDFDRCTGRIAVRDFWMYSPTFGASHFAMGMAFSPNGDYLYVHTGRSFYQYDMQADDLSSSEFLIGDWDEATDQGFSTAPNIMQLAPDGKIYISTTSSTHFLHVIHQPNKAGSACELEQRGLELPVWNGTIPNMPHYRLGPVDGSSCDTLDIDNVPLAGWRADVEDFTVDFTDVSWYEPETWSWTFGDGGTSMDTSPVHTYADTGVYNVCLIVQNDYGMDTMCKQVVVGTMLTSTGEIEGAKNLSVFPNPARDHIGLQWSAALRPIDLSLYDGLGRLVLTERPASGQTEMGLAAGHLPRGVYHLLLRDRTGRSIRKAVVLQ